MYWQLYICTNRTWLLKNNAQFIYCNHQIVILCNLALKTVYYSANK